MTIADSFVDSMSQLGVGVPGQNIFSGETPPSNHTSDNIWWVIESGGSKIQKAFTGESIKQYSLLVYNRGRDYGAVSSRVSALEEVLNCPSCVTLNGYNVLEMEVVQFPTDRDLDSEDRKVGLLQINIKTYKEC